MQSDLTRFKDRFDAVLVPLIAERAARARSHTDDARVLESVRYVEHVAAAGGKRVRPYVAWTMYTSMGGEDESILASLAGLEIFHIFALIHDDLMDRGTFRHGLPTLHIDAASRMQGVRPERRVSTADAHAVLVGDLAFAWALDVFEQTLPASVRASALEAFHTMVYEVVIGQLLDITLSGQVRAERDAVEKKTELKTACYTFVQPMKIGAVLAGVRDVGDLCDLLGRSLGIAFQVRDDLLDIIGDPATTGKGGLADLEEGQHTLFTQYIYDEGSKDDQERLTAFMGRKLTETERQDARALFELSGAIRHGKQRIAAELSRAEEIIRADERLNARPEWTELVELLRTRTT